jgi:spore coat protein A, manganese oxidase
VITSRRRFLGLAGGAGVAMLGLGGCGTDRLAGQTGEVLRSEAVLPPPFAVPLPIPAVKRPVRTDGTTDYYEIVQREASVEILPGLRTPIFGYDGTFPGPTIESRSGRRIIVRHRNELPVPTVVHLHGGHTPAEHDGQAIDLVLPAGVDDPHRFTHGMAGRVTSGHRDYVYPGDQRAATLWYHDHRMDFTAPQVYRGLAGFHLVRDDEESATSLPGEDRDVPLMIMDRSFAEDGAFRYPSLDPTLTTQRGVQPDYMEGVFGDTILVNGAPWPSLEVDAARYRFRILNASNARRYRLALESAAGGGLPFVQVGSDGGLLAHPVSHERIDIASGERFEVVIDFGSVPVGTEVTLVNHLGESPSTARVMRFVVARKAADPSSLPEVLSTIEPLDPAKAVRTRDWTFTRGKITGHGDHGGHDAGWTINGLGYDPARMDAQPKLGEIEIWRFGTDLHHPVHVHLDPFQVVSRRGRKPSPYDLGWKDTVDVRPTEYVEVAVRFTDYRGRYLIHCHNLEHEDMAMMATFQTV